MSKKTDNHEQTKKSSRGTLMSHLLELRSRLNEGRARDRAVLIALTPFANSRFDIVSAPLRDVLGIGK